MRRTLATMMAAGLMLAACSGDEPDILDLATEEPEPEETATAEPEPEAEEEPEPEDPYAVPDEIDEPYVESVINAILEVHDDILRQALEQEQGTNLEPDAVERLFSITDAPARMTIMEEFQEYVDAPEARANLLDSDQLGTSTVSVERLIHVEDSCLIFIGFWDNSELVHDARSDDSFTAFSLSLIEEMTERSAGNPTPWVWRDRTAMADGDGVIPRDQWDELPYSDALEHSCSEDF